MDFYEFIRKNADVWSKFTPQAKAAFYLSMTKEGEENRR